MKNKILQTSTNTSEENNSFKFINTIIISFSLIAFVLTVAIGINIYKAIFSNEILSYENKLSTINIMLTLMAYVGLLITIKLQNQQIIDSKKDASLDRLSTFTYNQIEKIENVINNLELKKTNSTSEVTTYEGIQAIAELTREDLTIDFLTENQNLVFIFLLMLKQYTEVLNRAFIQENISDSDKNLLKGQFILNLGHLLVIALENIEKTLEPNSNNINTDEKHFSKIFIRNIIEIKREIDLTFI